MKRRILVALAFACVGVAWCIPGPARRWARDCIVDRRAALSRHARYGVKFR